MSTSQSLSCVNVKIFLAQSSSDLALFNIHFLSFRRPLREIEPAVGEIDEHPERLLIIVCINSYILDVPI